jgi:hypothetical protein
MKLRVKSASKKRTAEDASLSTAQASVPKRDSARIESQTQALACPRSSLEDGSLASYDAWHEFGENKYTTPQMLSILETQAKIDGSDRRLVNVVSQLSASAVISKDRRYLAAALASECPSLTPDSKVY